MQQVTVFVAGINRFPNMAEWSSERLAIQLTGIQYTPSGKKINVILFMCAWILDHRALIFLSTLTLTTILTLSLTLIYI